jgi:hypothetical protein
MVGLTEHVLEGQPRGVEPTGARRGPDSETMPTVQPVGSPGWKRGHFEGAMSFIEETLLMNRVP